MIEKQYTKILQFMADGAIGVELPEKVARTKAGIARMWEEMHYLLPRQLDELTDQLSGAVKISSTKEKALARLEPWFAQAAGGLYAVPKQSNPTTEKVIKENTMSKFATPEVKKEVAATVPNKHAKKKAAVKAKVAAKVVKKSAKAAPAAKAKSAGGQRGQREGTIASIITAGIKAKKDPAKIIAEVKKHHPRSKSTERDVAWYKWKLGQK